MRPSIVAFLAGLSLVLAPEPAMAQAATPRQVFINRSRLSSAVLAQLEPPGAPECSSMAASCPPSTSWPCSS